MRKTLQNRKKCPTTKAITKPSHHVRDQKSNEPRAPDTSKSASNAENRNPGLNSGIGIGIIDTLNRIRRRESAAGTCVASLPLNSRVADPKTLVKLLADLGEKGVIELRVGLD
jgi:hypothetical protein